jgi:hypothetical protein
MIPNARDFFKKDNIKYKIAVMPFESLIQQYENNANLSILSNFSSKTNLDNDIQDNTNSQKFKKYNSDYEYDEMEGKESIAFINSHAERNLEKQGRTISGIPDSSIQKNKTRVSIFFNNTTPISNTQSIHVIREAENIQAKESNGLIQSKVRGQFEPYNKQKINFTDNAVKNIEHRIKETQNRINSKVTDVPLQNKTEVSRLLYSNTEISTDINNLNFYSNSESKDTLQIQQSPEVHKYSKFGITIGNNETFDLKDTPLITTSSIDYKYVLNSTDMPFTVTVAPTATSSLTQQHTTSNNSKRIFDTVQESNSPLEISFSSNSNKNLTTTDSKSPIEIEILERLISQQENQPINFEDLEIVRSDQINQKINVNKNNEYVIDSTIRSKTHENIKTNQMQQQNEEFIINYSSQSKTPTIIQLPEYQLNDQNQHIRNKDFQIHQTLTHDLKNQPYESIDTADFDQQNQEYYSNYEEIPRDFKNKEVDHGNFKNLRNFKVGEFLSISDRNNPAYQKELVHSNNYENQQQEPINLNAYPNQSKDKNYHNVQDYTGNYPINYQTHHDPETYVDYIQNSQNYKVHTAQTYNYQNTESFNNNNNYQGIENDQNYKNINKPLYSQNNNKNQVNKDYSDCQNYESSEEISEASHFEGFGDRIIKKNKNGNIVKGVESKQKIIENANEHLRISNVQGKDNNFVYTMIQFVENDSLPRPFIPDNNNKFYQNSNNKDSNFPGIKEDKIYFNSINNFKEISNKNNNIGGDNTSNYNINKSNFNHNNNYYYENYNEFNINKSKSFNHDNINHNIKFNEHSQKNFPDSRYKINADNFSASNFERIPFPVSPNNVEYILGLDNQQHFNRPVEENHSSTHSVAENSFQILPNFQSSVSTYNNQRSPELQSFSFNNDQQLTQISQPNYNEFNTENIQKSNGNIRILNDLQPQLINNNYYQISQSNVENIQLSDKNLEVHPELIHYNLELSTQKSIENNQLSQTNSRLTQKIQSEVNDYDFRSTIATPEINVQNQAFRSDSIKYNETEVTSTQKSLVETEFIPSISFDFGSDEGMKAYLEALKKGLVTNDGDSVMKIDQDNKFSTNMHSDSVEKITKIRKIENSKIINNFKDNKTIMSKTE